MDDESASYGARLSALAAEDPRKLAFVHVATDGTETAVRLGDLERRANQAARLLEPLGVGPGTVVSVALPNTAEHFVATYGAWKLGATVLPLRWDLPVWERERLLDLARPVVVVAEWPGEAWTTVAPRALKASATLAGDPLPDRVPQPARAIASSGSTGSPKLIVSPAPGVFSTSDAETTRAKLNLPPRATQLVASPLYHTNGFNAHNGLLAGQTLVVMERFDAERAVDLIERWRVNYAVMVPTMLQRIARLPDFARRDFSSVYAIKYGGGPIAPWVVRAWCERIGADRFFIAYGGSEAIGLVTARGDEWLAHPGSVGRPADCELRILGEDGREVGPGETGEIFLRRFDPSPSFEYVGSPSPRCTADGFSTYGDLGWIDDDGYLYVVDRRVDMVVTGGANVYPAEVEHALSEHPGVADVVVIGVPDPEWGRRLHAIVEVAKGFEDLTADDLAAHTRDRLTGYKVPKTFEVVAALPRTAAGKVNRGALAADRIARA